MKILYFHQYFSTPHGFTGSRSYAFALKLIQRGHEVTIVCGNSDMSDTGINEKFTKGVRSSKVDGINVIEFYMPYSNKDNFIKRSIIFLRFAFRSSFIALRHEYDILFATSTPLTIGIPGILGKLFRKKVFIFEVRDLWPELPIAMGVVRNPLVIGLMRTLEKINYYTADHIIGLSPGIVSGIQNRGVKDNKISMIPNGCDIDLFSKENVMHSLPINFEEDDFVAVYSGAHGLANGLDAVIETAIELKRMNENKIKLVLIGDGKLKKTLVARANEEKLKNIVFLDPMPKVELASFMRKANLGMQILENIPEFYYGTSPNKFFDYLAAGLPVLVNYPGWLSEIISEFNNGISVPPNDPLAFAKGIVQLRNQKNELKKMADSSVLLASEFFNREKLSTKFIEVIESSCIKK